MEAAQKLVKQRSMEALDKLRIVGSETNSRRSSTTSNVMHSVNVNSRKVRYTGCHCHNVTNNISRYQVLLIGNIVKS